MQYNNEPVTGKGISRITVVIAIIFTAAMALAMVISDHHAKQRPMTPEEYMMVEENFGFPFTPRQHKYGPAADEKFFKIQQEMVDKELWKLIELAHKNQASEMEFSIYRRGWIHKAALARLAGFHTELEFEHALWLFEKHRNPRIVYRSGFLFAVDYLQMMLAEFF